MSVLSMVSELARGSRPGRVRVSACNWFRMRQVSAEKRSRTIDAMPRMRPSNSRALPGRCGW